MTHQEGEARIKSLQKEFLSWVEEHPHLGLLDHDRFNQVRRQAFTSTFEAFKMGRVGIKVSPPAALWYKFFAWAQVQGLPRDVEFEVQAKCFIISLEAFRVGAMVTGRDQGVQDAIHSR